MSMLQHLKTLALGAFLLFSGLSFAGVNVNTASQSQLETLPGIGPSKAAAIIEYRNTNGSFTSLAQLDAVPGIGPATLQKITPLVSFDGEAPAANTSTSTAESSTTGPSIPQAADTSGAININTASQSELQSLPGIGPSKAVAIIQDRESNGPFESCGQLTRVRGVGSSTAANIAARCTTD